MDHPNIRAVDLSTEALIAAAASVPEGQPFHMLNLLRYKAQATYPEGSAHAPCTGREAYHQGYIGGFSRLTQGAVVEVAWVGSVLAGLVVPPGERWDELAIVRYPSFEVFRAYVSSAAYEAELLPHRLAALEDWRLLATAKHETP